MVKMMKVLGFGGSLRKGSYNSMLLEESKRLLPADADMEIFDISNLPFFSEDDEKNPPENVMEFKKAIEKADGIIISTPEYLYSVPGYLKNALDISSRFGNNSFSKKHVAIMSASRSVLGGSRAQYHLRQSFVNLDAKVVNKPEVFIAAAHNKFDENGKLKDDTTIKLISELLNNLLGEIAAGER